MNTVLIKGNARSFTTRLSCAVDSVISPIQA